MFMQCQQAVPDSLQITGTQLWCYATACLMCSIDKHSIQMKMSQISSRHQCSHSNARYDKVTHVMTGLHTKGNPKAALTAWYTPKFSRNPRTVAMIMKAATAKRFSRSGGTL